ncbi:MAG: FmdB family transcriptional regulator [Treponema sp.]|jgi:putative FmdB family regulatory protein|nr:FmdB family transcriptional regulator [Treponema sp.]
MPTYEYECKSCSFNFEVFQAMSDPPLKECPKCNKEIRRLIFGGAGVIFKGSGFYVTDKGAKSASLQKSEGASSGSPCSTCPSGGEAGKCPAAAEKAKPESKSA